MQTTQTELPRKHIPDPKLVSRDMINLAHHNGIVKQCLNLFLEGDVTYTEALELIVKRVCKDNLEMKKLTSQCLKEIPQVAMGLPAPEKLERAKLMPKNPL